MPGSIVERLRESVKACRAIDRSQLLAEAADEIDRLRGELEKASAVVNACIEDYGKLRSLCANGRYLTEDEAAALIVARAALVGRGCHASAAAVQSVCDRYSDSAEVV